MRGASAGRKRKPPQHALVIIRSWQIRLSLSQFLSPASRLPPHFLRPIPRARFRRSRLLSDDGASWTAEKDLLSSDDTDHVFVPEIERDNSIFLRFGDGQYGKFPDAGLSFLATYRVGNGNIGNIARDSLAHIVLPPAFLPPLAEILSVSNPLAAAGGLDPEDMDHIRQYAPFAYQTQLRCVTEDDYGVAAAGFPGIREARGTLRWTGSWYTAFVSVDPIATFTTRWPVTPPAA